MLQNMEDNGGEVVDSATMNKGLDLNYQINGMFVNGMSNGHHENYITTKAQEEDDEEWYPPSPPVYDVAEKLVEINRVLYDDPASLIRHGPGKLRWKPDSYLVQVMIMTPKFMM